MGFYVHLCGFWVAVDLMIPYATMPIEAVKAAKTANQGTASRVDWLCVSGVLGKTLT